MHRARLVLALLFAGALLIVPAAQSASSDMVVSQVYAGGGNSGATYANDFVELFNRGASAIDISSWSIQYASAAGTSWQVTPLGGSVQPGKFFLVQLASAAAVGAALPTPDATGTTNLANSGGKVALVRSATALTCGASAGSCSADASVADLIGYGSASDFEGSGAATGLSNTTAALRADDGCTDTDANASDFAGATPSPRNSAVAAAPCAGGPPPGETASGSAGVDIDIQGVLSIALEQQNISFGNAQSGDSPAAISERVTVSSNNAAGYALTVHRSAFQPADLPLGMTASAPSGGQIGALARGRREGRDPDRSGSRSADRNDLGAERIWRRCLADERQLPFGAARGSAGEVHGHGDVHGHRTMIVGVARIAALAGSARARVRFGGRERGTPAGRAHRFAGASRARRGGSGDGTRDELRHESGRSRRPSCRVRARSPRPPQDRGPARRSPYGSELARLPPSKPGAETRLDRCRHDHVESPGARRAG